MNQEQEREIQPIDECDTELCRALWVATALQAVVDARSNSSKKELQKAKAEALEWLQAKEGEGSDFAYVSNLADIDYKKAQSRLLEIVNDPDKIADFRCIKKALLGNRGMELRSKYFKRMRRQEEQRQMQRAKRLAEKKKKEREILIAELLGEKEEQPQSQATKNPVQKPVPRAA